MAEAIPGQPMEEVLASIRRIMAEDPPGARAASDGDDVLELGPIPTQAPAAAPVSPPPQSPLTPPADALLSEVSAAASRQALAQLSGVAIDPAAPVNSLDGLVREMLRPMLKAWLDTHLPDIVERMVAREIARIGGR